MRGLLLLFIVAVSGVVSVSAETPHIPRTNEIVRYNFDWPVFASQQIARERGDALLTLLEGGRQLGGWMENVSPSKYICVLPVPMNLWVNITLTNGTAYKIGLSADGTLLDLPADGERTGLHIFTNPHSKQAAKEWMAAMQADLAHEKATLSVNLKNAPKPCSYKMGTVDDGGTLSGVARLFYGDAGKWPKIYEANRSVIKNPNEISGYETLTIPKLK